MAKLYLYFPFKMIHIFLKTQATLIVLQNNNKKSVYFS